MSDQNNDDSSEKPHEPSQKRLQDARQKGEVPRSMDLMATASYGGFLLWMTVFGAGATVAFGTAMMPAFDQAPDLAALMLQDGGRTVAGGLMSSLGAALAPMFLLPAGLVIASIFAQNAFTVAPSKLAPKLNRISLLQNAKQKFGRSGLFEFAKSVTKLVIFGTVLAVFLWRSLPDMVSALHLEPGRVAALIARTSVQFLSVVVVVTGVIGALDFLFQRNEHMRRNRMSHKDVQDEAKQTEGDPMMRQKRRERAQTIANNRMMHEVPQATVVVVNPTHYAVALSWTRAPGSAPVCVAKGVDEIAAQIRLVADEAGVPIHQDAPTARALHATVEIGAEIAPEHYQAVAAAIRFADGLRVQRSNSYG